MAMANGDSMSNTVVDFIGGALDRHRQDNVGDVELLKLGYRAYLTSRDQDGVVCILAVPVDWTEGEASWALVDRVSVKCLANPVMW